MIRDKVRNLLKERVAFEGIVDISVGTENELCISRRMLLNAAKELTKEPHHYIYRVRKGTDVITVISRFGFKPTIEHLKDRYFFRR